MSGYEIKHRVLSDERAEVRITTPSGGCYLVKLFYRSGSYSACSAKFYFEGRDEDGRAFWLRADDDAVGTTVLAQALVSVALSRKPPESSVSELDPLPLSQPLA